jgi:hypothetical protein
LKPSLTLLPLGLLLAGTAGAHHSGAAFDRTKTVEVVGTVAEIEWTSPHARLKVDAKDASGAKVTWDFELPSAVTLTRRGWTKASLAPGEPITVTGAPARDHPLIAIATGVIDKSGRRLFGAAANETE